MGAGSVAVRTILRQLLAGAGRDMLAAELLAAEVLACLVPCLPCCPVLLGPAGRPVMPLE